MNTESKETLRLLLGLENGTLTTADAYNLAEVRDPVLIYFVLRFLREKYPPSQPTSAGVVQRLIDLTRTYADIVKKSKQGEKDPLREWFDDAYAIRDYFDRPGDFIEMIVEKIDS
jgi:hypothetical protein